MQAGGRRRQANNSVKRLTLPDLLRGYDSGGAEWMESPPMRTSIESTPPPDAPPAFRWWTFGVLILYSASLLVFCGFVTVQKYSSNDGPQIGWAAANPPHLAIAPFRLANVALPGPPPRMVCYQVAD